MDIADGESGSSLMALCRVTHHDRCMKKFSTSNQILIWGAVVVAVLLVVATVLNATNEVTLDPESPEGVVQLFVVAALDGEDDEAMSYLSPPLRERCQADRFFGFRDEGARVALVDTRLDGDTAEVDIIVTEGSYGLLDTNEYRHDESFELNLSEAGWQITEFNWPWYECFVEVEQP